MFYLHNNPSPATGNTTSQHDLPCDGTVPIAATLFNYDTDRDSGPGRVIQKGGSGAGELDPQRHQHWRTPAYPAPQLVNGNVRLELYVAAKDFGLGEMIHGAAYLSDISPGGGSTLIGQGSFGFNSTGTWTLTTVFMGVNQTLAAGHSLELTLISPGSSADDLWVAYDTAAYKSRIVLP